MPQTPPSRLAPVLALGLIVVLALLAWWLFPIVQGFVANQDCVATGRTNC